MTVPPSCEVCGAKMRPNGKLPSNHYSDRRRQTLELGRKARLLSIVPPRAQASRRCETQASLRRQASQAALAFRSLDSFRPLREPDPRRRDEEAFPLRTKQPKTNLTGKAPYKFESCMFRRGVGRTFRLDECGALKGRLANPAATSKAVAAIAHNGTRPDCAGPAAMP